MGFNPLFAGLTLKVKCPIDSERLLKGFNPLFAGLTLKAERAYQIGDVSFAFQSPICGADAQSRRPPAPPPLVSRFNPLFAGLTLKVLIFFSSLSLVGFQSPICGADAQSADNAIALVTALEFQSPICGADAQSNRIANMITWSFLVSIPYLRG